MYIAGIGIIFSRGRGIESFSHALQKGWKPPQFIEHASFSDKPIPLYAVDQEFIMDKAVLGKSRRADRFCKMAVLAAWDAVKDSGLSDVLLNGSMSPGEDAPSLGIIHATALGPHTTTFRFLDDILDYGEANVSPTAFSHSVHNAAASYIASVLDIRGPTITVSQFVFSFHQALLLAQSWLEEKRCDFVLVGSTDECGQVMEYICRQKLHIADDGRIKPFHFSASPEAVPGEGSVFFLMTQEKNLPAPARYGEVYEISLFDHQNEEDAPDICLIETDGMTGDETACRNDIIPGAYVAGYSPLFGSFMAGSGFQCAAAALMLKRQIRYACPVQDNPYGVNLCTATEPSEIRTIYSFRHCCGHKKAVIKLRR
ncbi:MAG: beta-ketoacyl synthase N-terminal-like domain-containing protein [bacterium]